MKETFCHPKSLLDYKFLTIVITLCLHFGCSQDASSINAIRTVNKSQIDDAINQAEHLFAERASIENLRKAATVLNQARDPNNRNYDVEWRYSKICYFLGKAEKEPEESEKIFERGRDAGKIAARLEPEKPDGHFWYAANIGELARMSPITVGLKSLDEIRESFLRVIAIQPDYQGASAFDALGDIELSTRFIGGGRPEKAVEYLEQGLKLAPDNSNIRLHLAQAYLYLKRDKEARRELETIISMKPNPDYVTEHAAAVEKARELLQKNF
ncbi:MAG: TRAP transporter TatT component family protein [Pyrinomonadaceae bacterium]